MAVMETPRISDLEQAVAREGLEKYLDNLIAEKEHVRPEDITEEYIRRERRERKVYAAMRYDVDSGYGGDTTLGLEVVTRDEIDAGVRRMDEARKAYSTTEK
jgi:hypothetical protein